jgi:methionyl-tRNA formyltransferase
MRIVFMGTPEFAAKSLKRLYADGHDLCGVFTQPDKPRNRGMKVVAPPVKEIAAQHNTRIFQPNSLKGEETLSALRGLDPELIVVVAYGKFLPESILALPTHGCINIHGSLLPAYRGAAPIQWAILNGEKETGVTSMYMAPEMDAGDMILWEKTPIGEYETFEELYDRLSVVGADLLSETIARIQDGTAQRTPQEHEKATFAPMITPKLSPINWENSSDQIINQIRGLNPWPSAKTQFNGETLKIFAATKRNEKKPLLPGSIIGCTKEGIEVACGGGSGIIITELQAPGGKRLPASEYLKGHTVEGTFR